VVFGDMLTAILSLFSSARQAFHTRAALQTEILNDIQRNEAEAALTRRSGCNNVALGRKWLDGVFGKHRCLAFASDRAGRVIVDPRYRRE